MALPIYSTGTVSVTTGGGVTVSGGIWAGINVVAGDVISVDGGATVLIRDVSDATHAQLAGWTGGAVSGKTYVVYQNSPRRFDDVQIADDLRKQVQALNTQGFYVFVPPGATEPDPSLGDDGQYAFQAMTGKMWLKASGLWTSAGVYKGINPRGAWNSATAYAVNDVVSLNGSAYMAIAANTNSQPPSANWMDLGAAGAAATVDVGTTTTLAPGASATVTPSGTANARVLNFGIPTGKGYGGTSTTSMAIGTGNKTFTTQAGLAYVVGDRVHIGAVGNELNWMEGFVTAYSDTSMTVNVVDIDGSGTFASWGIGLTGNPGTGDGDMKGANNLSDLANKPQARANLGVEILSGFRNKIINGDFGAGQRFTTAVTYPAGGGFSMPIDRWYVSSSLNQSHTVYVGEHIAGQTNVPGNPKNLLGLNLAAAPTSGIIEISQRIESCRTLSGKTATITMYITGPSVGAGDMYFFMRQNYGSGGSPSSPIYVSASLNINTIYNATTWKRVGTASVPSISGKTLGTANDGYLELVINLTPRAAGTYYISHVSVVEGDATAETDPFAARHPAQEMALCQRYYEARRLRGISYATNTTSELLTVPITYNTMKRIAPTVTMTFAAGNIGSYVVRENYPGGFSANFTMSGTPPAYMTAVYDWTADAEL